MTVLRSECTGHRPVHFFGRIAGVAAALVVAAVPTSAFAEAPSPAGVARPAVSGQGIADFYRGRSDYPFWLLTARSMQYAWGANVGMQMIKEVADNITGHKGVVVNAQAAARLGIADGDAIEIATPKRKVGGRAVLRQGIRPDTLLLVGQFDHWETPLAKDFDMPSLNSLATMSIALTDATGSGADIVRVALRRRGEKRS